MAKQRPRRPGMKLVQVYAPEETVNRFKAAVALLGQNMSEAICDWMETVAANVGKPPPPKSRKR